MLRSCLRLALLLAYFELGHGAFYDRGISQCGHRWMKNWTVTDCPYGFALPFDVTFPDFTKARLYHADIEHIIVDGVPKHFLILCIFYSYVLGVVFINAFVQMVTRRGTRELNYFCFLATIIMFIEFLAKPLLCEPRPEMSCHTSCGMPSSHAAVALGTLVLYVGDGALRSIPRLQSSALVAPGYFNNLETFDNNEDKKIGNPVINWLRCELVQYKNHFTHRFDEPSSKTIVLEAGLWLFFVFPVPLSRVQLGDHSERQVCVGGFLGILIASLWITMTRRLQIACTPSLGQKCLFGLFEHNLALPCAVAIRHLCHSTNTSTISTGRARHVLKWYERETLRRLLRLATTGGLTKAEENYLKLRWCTLHELMGPLTEESKRGERMPLSTWEDLRNQFLHQAHIGRAEHPAPRRFFSGCCDVYDDRLKEKQDAQAGTSTLDMLRGP